MLCLVYILIEMARECERCIRLVFRIPDLFSSHLEALRHMSVNQSRVKRNENVSTLSCSSYTRLWMSTFVCILSRSHLAKSLDEYSKWECKPCSIWIWTGIGVRVWAWKLWLRVWALSSSKYMTGSVRRNMSKYEYQSKFDWEISIKLYK